jgi:hypothetical protein
MKPVAGQKHVKPAFRFFLLLYPLARLFFPALTLNQVGRAMIQCVRDGAGRRVLEVPDIAAQSARD